MPRIYLCLPVICLLLGWTVPAHAELRASIDRHELAVGETLVLTIEASGITFSQPDFSILDNDFDTFGTNQSSQSHLVNGKLSSITRWSIQLAPKRAGKTRIPAIKVGKGKTSAIELQVNQQPSQNADQQDIDIMLEATLTDNTIYVGAQTQLIIKVSAATPANIQIDEPKHDDARIEQVNKISYQQVRGSQHFRVTEFTYVVIPTQTGELELEPLTLVAELAINQRRSLRSPFMGQSRRVIRRSETITLNVIPPPADIDATDWLPAQKVTLREQWSKDPATLQVGDSVTRSIEFRADGALASQLPPLFMSDIPGLKFYPDQPSVSDSHNARSISGKRVEKIALVATEPGRVELPAVSVAWWDVNTNRPMEARLPARVIEVSPAPQGAKLAAAPTIDTDATLPQLASPPPWYRYGPWWWISGALALGLITLGTLYAHTRHRLGSLLQSPVAEPADTARINSETEAFRHLQQACDGNRPSEVYSALLQWARIYWGRGLGGVDELEQAGANPQLVLQATALQQQLYGGFSSGDYQSPGLLDAVKRQRNSTHPATTSAPILPPLYRN